MENSKDKDNKIKKINKQIKIRTWIVYICVWIAFGAIFADLIINKNFFVHNEILMLLSLFAFAFSIYNNYAIKRLRSEKKVIQENND